VEFSAGGGDRGSALCEHAHSRLDAPGKSVVPTSSEANAPEFEKIPSTLEIVTLAATATCDPQFRFAFASDFVMVLRAFMTVLFRITQRPFHPAESLRDPSLDLSSVSA
jgi:hypothetical protein